MRLLHWLFSDSTAGADASAIVCSIVEMAKEHGLNIYKYLEYLLVHRPNIQMSDDKLEASTQAHIAKSQHQ